MKKLQLQRYNAGQRSNHWAVVTCFVLAAASGFALFHPALFWLTALVGGPQWARILHPYLGIAMFVLFLGMFFMFVSANRWRKEDSEWLASAGRCVQRQPSPAAAKRWQIQRGPKDRVLALHVVPGRVVGHRPAILASLVCQQRAYWAAACRRFAARRCSLRTGIGLYCPRLCCLVGQRNAACHGARHRKRRLGQAPPSAVVS